MQKHRCLMKTIAHVRTSNDLIHYRLDDKGKLGSLRKIRTETYQDALKIIQIEDLKKENHLNTKQTNPHE
ncbi:hypothetical protein ELAC_0341 [Estrella lausannensis]|uniref:Uncharacterized protein n=1 Tax=Estrella lausannensis TaxID=483423 RepID=A0A0H5DNE3_9BACT|nr:hypothetical protein ELAC_0341 [Estrella lausannensis]